MGLPLPCVRSPFIHSRVEVADVAKPRVRDNRKQYPEPWTLELVQVEVLDIAESKVQKDSAANYGDGDPTIYRSKAKFWSRSKMIPPLPDRCTLDARHPKLDMGLDTRNKK